MLTNIYMDTKQKAHMWKISKRLKFPYRFFSNMINKNYWCVMMSRHLKMLTFLFFDVFITSKFRMQKRKTVKIVIIWNTRFMFWIVANGDSILCIFFFHFFLFLHFCLFIFNCIHRICICQLATSLKRHIWLDKKNEKKRKIAKDIWIMREKRELNIVLFWFITSI